jgi:hypothetical protein
MKLELKNEHRSMATVQSNEWEYRFLATNLAHTCYTPA